MTGDRKYSDRELFRRLFWETRPCWPHIAGLFLLSFLGTPLTLLNPWPLKLVLDCVLGTRPLPSALSFLQGVAAGNSKVILAVIALLVVLIAFAKQLTDLAFSLLRTYAGEKL